jgi:hypothetical protein
LVEYRKMDVVVSDETVLVEAVVGVVSIEAFPPGKSVLGGTSGVDT